MMRGLNEYSSCITTLAIDFLRAVMLVGCMITVQNFVGKIKAQPNQAQRI
jgi:cell division protein ZapA (FtsZ GTPase activity inhibitor)